MIRGPLVDVADLTGAEAAGGGAISILDVRWSLGGPPGLPGYRVGHVPGARYADLELVFGQAPASPVDDRGRHPLPDPATLETDLRALGVQAGQVIVLVDAGDMMAAARAWWVLRWAGLPAQLVGVLDGGLAAWAAAGLATESGEPAPAAPGSVVLDPTAEHLPTVDAVGAAAAGAAGLLVDARAARRWRGEIEPVDPRAGHIPGALNLPWNGDLDGEGRLLAAPVLVERLRSAGIGSVGSAVSCGSGVSAAHLVLAAAVAGLPLPALYPGSYSGWCADPTRPVETAEQTIQATGDGT